MELSKNTWHYKLFLFTYGDKRIPLNFCTYFRKIVLAILIFIPVNIISFPGYVLIKTRFIDYYNWKYGYTNNPTLAAGSFILIGLLILYSTIAIFWTNLTGKVVSLYQVMVGVLGIIGWIIIAVLITWNIVMLVKYITSKGNSKKKYHTYENAPEPNILIEFIKARYRKYCPLITWKNE